MKYYINKFEVFQSKFGLVVLFFLIFFTLLMKHIIFTILCLLLIPAVLFTGTYELEISSDEIIVYRGLCKIKYIIKISSIKSFTINRIFVGKIVFENNKSVLITFSRFNNWGKLIETVYRAIKAVDDIKIDNKILDIVNKL